MNTTLALQIEELNRDLLSQLPQEIVDAFGQSIEDLQGKNIGENSIQVGDKMPEFSLPNAWNKIVNSDEVSKGKKMILAFYRGSWCPYCNLELKSLQDNLSRIENKNAVLLAISPQSPDHSLTVIEKGDLKFELLTDLNNDFARKLGLVFQLQDFVLPHYQKLGIDLSVFNKNSENTLPVPAVFVVDENKIVTYKFLDVNYMNRVDAEEIVKVL